MFERDCSLQRRHQKVIEEAPAPGMTEDVRKAMTDAAVKAAKAVNYVGAGTVEFIVDGSGKLRTDGFWFMEMNTRLQVEHPVTEMITGLDLVELQIRVAQGEELPKQKNIPINGHAIEARLYAEDPANDFLPSIGRIKTYDLSDGGRHTRVDSGVETGSDVSIHYDPMIAKIIVRKPTRREALAQLASELYYESVEPLTTNREFLYALLTHHKFKGGHVSTHYISENFKDLIPKDLSVSDEALALAAAKLLLPEQFDEVSNHPFAKGYGWKLNLPAQTIFHFLRKEEIVAVSLLDVSSTGLTAKVGDETYKIQMDRLSNTKASHLDALSSFNEWSSEICDNHVKLWRQTHHFKVPRYVPSGNSNTVSANALTAPMPGKIIAVNAKAGDAVKAGDPLIIIQAREQK